MLAIGVLQRVMAVQMVMTLEPELENKQVTVNTESSNLKKSQLWRTHVILGIMSLRDNKQLTLSTLLRQRLLPQQSTDQQHPSWCPSESSDSRNSLTQT